MTENATILEFWHRCRTRLPELPDAMPEAWAFGASAEQADELLALVIAGTKTATASSYWDYEYAGEAPPEPGLLGIVVDGAGTPRALIETTAVTTKPFDRVTPAHAFAEGEGDRSLAHWRSVHEKFWREHSDTPRGFAIDMPVVCEEFRVLATG